MVKKGTFFCIVIGIVIACFCLFNNFNSSTKDELRLRIVANSDSEFDQAEKVIVKEIVQEILKDCDYTNLQEVEQRLNENMSGEITHQIQVSITDSYYPAKAYHNQIIPSGKYQTLLITIGEGKGQNFWTLLYPEYFQVSFEDRNEIEYRSYIFDKLNDLFHKS